jgi:hypothetical protein
MMVRAPGWVARPTIRMSPVIGASASTCRSRIVRPSIASALLSRPSKRVARPPARMAADIVHLVMAHG